MSLKQSGVCLQTNATGSDNVSILLVKTLESPALPYGNTKMGFAFEETKKEFDSCFLLIIGHVESVCSAWLSVNYRFEVMAAHCRNLDLAETIEELQHDDLEDLDVTDIYMEPPEPNVLSDEDSADEDGGGTIDNLTKRQLDANAEIVFSNNKRIGFSPDIEGSFAVMPQEVFIPTGGNKTTSISEG
ncbi:hypothetical protein J6590_042241 [Homalodisca vitripennis]|nr:hypothetical protein J6590_042241 [Homalodisca vitripennis]